MAYTANDYRIQVRGGLAGGEIWNNTWTFRGEDPVTEDVELLGVAIHQFYDDLFASGFANNTTAVGATAYALAGASPFDLDWEEVQGNGGTEALPSEVAMRVSLSGVGGVNGGPFLAGMMVSVLGSDGGASLTFQTHVKDTLQEFTDSLVAINWHLAIDRPTTNSVIDCGRVRVGRIFDVIRKRRSAMSEAYQSYVII